MISKLAPREEWFPHHTDYVRRVKGLPNTFSVTRVRWNDDGTATVWASEPPEEIEIVIDAEAQATLAEALRNE